MSAYDAFVRPLLPGDSSGYSAPSPGVPVTGTIIAAVFGGGGVASLVVTGVWARLFPELRRVDRLG